MMNIFSQFKPWCIVHALYTSARNDTSLHIENSEISVLDKIRDNSKTGPIVIRTIGYRVYGSYLLEKIVDPCDINNILLNDSTFPQHLRKNKDFELYIPSIFSNFKENSKC